MNKQHAYEIASRALEARRGRSTDELRGLVDAAEREVVDGPDGRTYFLEVSAERVGANRLRLTAIVDSGNSFRLERVEESVDVSADLDE